MPVSSVPRRMTPTINAVDRFLRIYADIYGDGFFFTATNAAQTCTPVMHAFDDE